LAIPDLQGTKDQLAFGASAAKGVRLALEEQRAMTDHLVRLAHRAQWGRKALKAGQVQQALRAKQAVRDLLDPKAQMASAFLGHTERAASLESKVARVQGACQVFQVVRAARACLDPVAAWDKKGHPAPTASQTMNVFPQIIG